MGPSVKSAEIAPHFRWAQQLTGDNHLWANGLALDAVGNSYVCGYMPGTGVFGSIVLTNYLPWVAYGGAFLVKYSREGKALWAVQGGGQTSEGLATGADSNGNVYMLCNLRSQTVPLAGTNVTGALGLAKYTSAGQPLWGRSLVTGNVSLDGAALAVAEAGHCYWVMNFGGTVTVGTNNLYGPIYRNGALSRCGADGQVMWVRQAEAPNGFSTAYGDVAVNRSGDPYVCGRFSGTASLGSTSIVSRGASDAVVARYTSGGDLLWIRTAGGLGEDFSYRLTVDNVGNCFIAGGFFHAINFGEVALTNDIATNFLFVAKYSPNGELRWVRQVGPSRDWHCVASDAEGNCYFAGEVGSTEIFYAKYSPDGEMRWSRRVEQPMKLNRMYADQLGHCYLAGAYNRPDLLFDRVTLGFTRAFNFDTYLAKLDTTTIPLLAIEAADGEISISWPVVADGYFLETKTDFAAPNAWMSNALAPTVSGARNSIRTSVQGSGALYRLKRP
jgi:hypothetical protein